MNILVIGTPIEEFISLLKNSKPACRIYTAANVYSESVPNIQFSSIQDLVYKAKALQIDVAINLDNNLIAENICEEFKKNRLNLISVNKKWLNLETSILSAKKLLKYYSVNTPEIINVPIIFPVNIVAENSEYELKINSMEESIAALKKLDSIKTFFEEYTEGEIFELVSIWDGKNIMFLNSPQAATEVKIDRLDLLKTKFAFMLSDEHADFIGFFTTKLIWFKNDWYVKSFLMNIDKNIDTIRTDYNIQYIINAAIYQKLNELM